MNIRNRNLGINWRGSKRALAPRIIETIQRLDPDREATIFDPFVGGAAITAALADNGWQVKASDLNKPQTDLLQAAFHNDAAARSQLSEYLARPAWVSREEFRAALAQRDNGASDWRVGMIQSLWSFGGNQRDYMFGRDVEPVKRAGHELVVNRDEAPFTELFGDRFTEQVAVIKNGKTIRERSRLLRVLARHARLQQLQQLQQLERLERLQQLQQLQQLEQLERLEQLQQLQQLEQLPMVEVEHHSYETAFSKAIQHATNHPTIIYCDPPYIDTGGYAVGAFDHNKFYNHVNQLPNNIHILISEKRVPGFLQPIWETKTPERSTNKGSTTRTEGLYALPHTINELRATTLF